MFQDGLNNQESLVQSRASIEMWDVYEEIYKKHLDDYPGAHVALVAFNGPSALAQAQNITAKACDKGALLARVHKIDSMYYGMVIGAAVFSPDQGSMALDMAHDAKIRSDYCGSDTRRIVPNLLEWAILGNVRKVVAPTDWRNRHAPIAGTSDWHVTTSETKAKQDFFYGHPGHHIVEVRLPTGNGNKGKLDLLIEKLQKVNPLDYDYYLSRDQKQHCVLALFKPEDADLAVGMANQAHHDLPEVQVKRWQNPETFMSNVFTGAVRCISPDFRKECHVVTGTERWDSLVVDNVIPLHEA